MVTFSKEDWASYIGQIKQALKMSKMAILTDEVLLKFAKEELKKFPKSKNDKQAPIGVN